MRLSKIQCSKAAAKLLAVSAALAVCSPAHAITECTVQIQRIFSGDDGYVWLAYTNGGTAYLSPTDPDRQATLAMAMSAQLSGHSVTVRYAADGVACNMGNRADLIGFWLN